MIFLRISVGWKWNQNDVSTRQNTFSLIFVKSFLFDIIAIIVNDSSLPPGVDKKVPKVFSDQITRILRSFFQFLLHLLVNVGSDFNHEPGYDDVYSFAYDFILRILRFYCLKLIASAAASVCLHLTHLRQNINKLSESEFTFKNLL